MNPNTTQKVLENFLKSKVTVSPIEFLYGEEEGTVLVAFDGDPDFDKLKNACQNSMLEDCQLEAMQVPVSYSVVVSGVENCTSLDTLELYFENTRRSGGSDVTEVKEISDGYFLITFKDSGVIDRVCQRTHKVDGKVITVQTFYEKLGHRVNHTRQTFKIPSPLVIKDQNKIHQLVTSDITKLEKQLSDHHAKLHWPGDMSGHLKLECLITEDDLDSSRLVISWEKAIQNILSNFLTTAGTTKAQVVVISPDVEVSTKNSSAIKKDRDLNKGDDIRVDDTKDHFNSSQEDYEHVPDINIEMPEKTQTDRHKVCPSLNLSPTSWKSVDFTTPEGLLVRVYPGSILHLDVDCIVNAANENLQHRGGVAHVLSYAAGYDFDRESRDYVYDHGPLRVGEVCTTTAGNLKYKGVIHSVGPRWHDYRHDQKRICLDDLKTAVKNSLEEADIQKYKSIAIPAISSGIFGVPKELCSQQYYRAVEEYSRTKGRHSTLTEVHFIDKDTQMCGLIQKTFTKCFTENDESSYYGAGPGGRGGNFSSSVMSLRNTTPVLQRSRSVSSDGDGSFVDPPNVNQPWNVEHSSSRGQRFEYQISNNLTVHIVHGNIVEIEADAIVSPENVQCDSTGSIAREIARVAGQGYRDIDQSELKLARRKPKLTEVLATLGGKSHFKYVLHVVAPKWDVNAIEGQHKYWIDLIQSYNNIFSRIDKEHLPITSLVLPILGTGKIEQPVPFISISKMLAKVCKSYAEKANARKTLYFCSNDSVTAKTLRDIFEKEFNKGNDGTETETDKTEHGRGAGLEVTEDCCICMDTMTKPKKLSCGHMFCTDCIDQQFKYKPACPQCGAVHGKITGDQPPGTMTMRTTKPYGRSGGSLPGYEGCGIINITYSFPPGKQGPDHPTPGRHYQGITRPGFLPDNKKGRLVAKLLKIAFDRKLVFTIGRSRTTGHDGVVIWNEIHHKTRMDGGPQAFGYPDPTYLDRVLDELKAKGVTEESLNDP